MNDTVCQNGVSSSQSSSHGHHESMPNIPTKRDEQHGRCSAGSLGQPATPYKPVSDHNAEKENERFQCRAVLLKLLQPPCSSVLHAQHNSCSLACQQTEKTLLKPDLCISHCLPRSGNQQASRNSVDIDREANEEWIQKTRQCNENLSRKDSNRSSLFPITVRCQSCEARVRLSYSEEFQSRTNQCQYFPEDRQQYFNGHACFRKDNCDINRDQFIPVQINSKGQRKDEESPQQMCPPTWSYKGCDSSMCQLSPSNQTLDKRHPEKDRTGAGKRTILQNTESLPDHLRAPAESGNDSPYQIDKRTRQDSSSSVQEKLEDHKLNSFSSYSMCSMESDRREPFCLSGEWSSPAVRIANGQGHRHEERNVILETTSESDNQTVPHSPNGSSPGPVIENQSDECTPVIVQCYSLSTSSPTFKPSSMNASQFMSRQKHNASVNISNDEVPTVSVSHSPRSSYQQHSPRSLKSANHLQNNEDFEYDSPAPSPRNIPNLHSHNVPTQSNHTTDESSTSELGVGDEENQTRSAVLPGPLHKSSAIPSGVPCLNCQAGQLASRRYHYLYTNDPRAEPPVRSSQSVSYQKTRCPPDLHVGHESGGTFPSWHTRQVPNESRTALKFHDYYEERRILVGKVYQDIPDSVESSHRNRTSTYPHARLRQLYQNDRCQSPRESAEIFHAQAGEESSTQICARQREIAVGSRKRKCRQPRPQRVNTNDPALTRKQYQHPIQHAEDRQVFSFYSNNFHHHARSPFKPDASLSKEVPRKGRKHVEVCGDESEIYSFEPVYETTDQHESSKRRNDHVLDSNSSRPKFCRSRIRSETYSPWRPLFHDKTADKVTTADRSEEFLVYRRGPVPSYAPVDRHRRGNHGQHEYQMNSLYQTRTPLQYFAYSNGDVMEHPFNSSPDGKSATERHQQVSFGRRTPENRIATGSGYDSTQRGYSPRVLPSYSDPPERSMPTDGSVTSHFEGNSESSWNVQGVPVHGKHRGNSLFYNALPSRSKSPRISSEEQSPLPNDNGCVSSTTVDDGADLHGRDDGDRPLQAKHPSATTDELDRPSTEQENRDLFLREGEVWANHVTPTVKERKFVCRYCSKKFAHFSTLQNHLRTHTGDKPFQCKFCSRRFAQSGVLKAHLRTHTGDKPFACMYCGKVFAQSTTLTNHLRTHTGQKPYVCQFCGKSFSQPSTLRKHELSHTKERPYPCKFCGKAFAQQSTLTNHLRSHTGQRPYKCHFCDKSFAQLSTLDRHLRLHSTVSLKPYQCRYCSKSFSYVSNLSSHMQSHEQEQGDT